MANAKNPDLERYLLLAKGAKGAACKAVIDEALSCPSVHVFGEFLALQNVADLEKSHPQHFNRLQLFAHGTYQQYKEHAAELPELNEQQLLKLRLLTITTLAGQQKALPYDLLKEQLEVSNLRDLEDLVIEASYRGLVGGKLDPLQQLFIVEFASGRDIQPGNVDAMIATLSGWLGNCSNVLATLQEKMEFANNEKRVASGLEEEVNKKVEELKATLKTLDEGKGMDYDEIGQDPRRLGSGRKGRSIRS